jgi:hypothetical protein
MHGLSEYILSIAENLIIFIRKDLYFQRGDFILTRTCSFNEKKVKILNPFFSQQKSAIFVNIKVTHSNIPLLYGLVTFQGLLELAFQQISQRKGCAGTPKLEPRRQEQKHTNQIVLFCCFLPGKNNDLSHDTTHSTQLSVYLELIGSYITSRLF